MNRNTLLLTFLWGCLLYFKCSYAVCILNDENIDEKSPIVFKRYYGSYKNLIDAIFLPKYLNPSSIIIKESKTAYLSCLDGEMNIKSVKQSFSSNYFTCVDGKLNGVYFNDILCENIPKSQIQRHGSATKKTYDFEIGFNVSKKFLVAYEGVFDDEAKSTKYTRHTISYRITDLFIKATSSGLEDLVCPTDNQLCNDFYAFDNQLGTIKGLFANADDQGKVERYFEKDSKYLARGYLVPNLDFNFPYIQKSINYFENVVPQWQQINNGNWKRLEEDIRGLTSTVGSLNVHTGTHEISQLLGTDLYLHVSDGTKRIPVPRFTWKIVSNVISGGGKKAVAFIMSNNPYDETESSSFSCHSVCSQLRYIDESKYNTGDNSYQKGYLYCCQVTEDLCNTIKNIPEYIKPTSDRPVELLR